MPFKTFFIFLQLGFFLNAYAQTLQWRTLPNAPFHSYRLEDVFFTDENTGWTILISPAMVFKTTNGGNLWDTVNLPVGSTPRSIGFFNSQTGVIGTLSLDSTQILYRTTNGGQNWSPLSLPDPKPKGICGISIVNENIAFAGGRWSSPGTVIKTTDQGASWTTVLSDTSILTSAVDCYFFSKDTGIVVGGYRSNSAVAMTTNGGNSWQRVYCCSRPARCWKISFVSRLVGYASIELSNYIIKTTDGGFTWNEVYFRNSGQQGIGFLNESTGWVGNGGQPMFETTNGGGSWFEAPWGHNVNRIRFLSDTLGYAVGRTVYKFSRGPSSINQISEIATGFYIEQNYPNPFNPTTKIKFSLPESSEVNITVFDMNGKEIKTLVKSDLTEGVYETQWDAGSHPSGVYFYKLITKNFSESKRMVLVK